MRFIDKEPNPYGDTGSARFKTYYRGDFIKSKLSPLSFYRYELPNAQIKKSGWNDGGLCPFHSDNNRGSFRINVSTGSFRCFACGASGSDVIAFCMTLYGLKFSEAVLRLSDEWGFEC